MKDSDRGATAVEYSIMVSLIATVIVVVVKVIGAKTNNSFRTLSTTL
jgi:Flp pilus assembly pilin Flp